MSDVLADVFGVLGGVPALPGARCRGKHHLFDPRPEGRFEAPEVTGQRHAQALALCDHCPALPACCQWLDTLPESRRPTGVVAGVVNVAAPRGRPTRDGA